MKKHLLTTYHKVKQTYPEKGVHFCVETSTREING